MPNTEFDQLAEQQDEHSTIENPFKWLKGAGKELLVEVLVCHIQSSGFNTIKKKNVKW